MELNFEKVNETYKAESVVNADFNIHLELENGGMVQVLATTKEGGKYASVFAGRVYDDGVFDHDFDAVVYPKYIQVIVTAEPVNGEITEA